jgi:hypothetical protein
LTLIALLKQKMLVKLDAPYQLENKKSGPIIYEKGGTSHFDWRSGK